MGRIADDAPVDIPPAGYTPAPAQPRGRFGLPNPLATRWGRLVAFFMLYITEGIPFGFTATVIATQMRRQGLGPAEIGLFVGTLYLPGAWKWLVGPIVDVFHSNRLGRRRGWILGMQLCMCAGLLALTPIDFVNHLKLFTAAVFFVNIFGATQDVAIDALACSTLTPQERGVANGLMFAGAYLGQAIGGAGVLMLTDHIRFNATFFFVAGSILAVTLFVVLPMREPTVPEAESAPGAPLQRVGREIRDYLLVAVRAFFGTRAAIAALVFAVLPAGSYALSLALATSLAVEFGLTDRQIGLLGAATSITSAVGCVAGGYLSDRFGRRRMLAFYVVATVIPTLYLAHVMHQSGWILPRDPKWTSAAAIPAGLVLAFWTASTAYALFQGLGYGTKTALFMDICTPAVAATQFTAYMALLNVVIWYSSTWQGWSAKHIGYPATLVIDAAVGLVSLLVLPLTLPAKSTPAKNR